MLWVSIPLNVLLFQSILSTTCVARTPSLKWFGTNLDFSLLYSTHLSSINLVSVYDNSWPSLCKSVIISLEPVFPYIFNDSESCDNEGSEFEIKYSMSSQIFENLVGLTWDNFTVPLSSHG